MEVLIAHQNEADFDLDFAILLALLHDTFEDTDTSFDEIETRFNKRVAIGVAALTKNSALPSKKERMINSLNKINALDKEVGLVKLADRITNLQRPPTTWNSDKVTAYWQEAVLINEQLQGKNNYLNKRLEQQIEKYKSYTL